MTAPAAMKLREAHRARRLHTQSNAPAMEAHRARRLHTQSNAPAMEVPQTRAANIEVERNTSSPVTTQVCKKKERGVSLQQAERIVAMLSTICRKFSSDNLES